jgi:hypothetical protein
LKDVRQIRCTPPAFALILLSGLSVSGSSLAGSTDPAASADAAAGDAQVSIPQQGFFSSLKQAADEDFDREVVRGHFDLGTPPNVHRYYCMVDPKTGRRPSNGVLGKPFAAPGGLTRLKETAVSLYRCVDAEKAGVLVTTGYVTGIMAAGSNAPSPQPQPQPQAQVQPPPPASPPTPAVATAAVATAAATAASSPDAVEVGGVKLGMSPDEVRSLLRAKKLPEYYESMDTHPVADGRFVNVIATWMPGEDGESYEVMFTPVPGKERAMAIVHSVAYSAANAVRETTLQNGLVKQYGGFGSSNDVPESPTWRFQGDGKVQVGDPCNRRGIFGAVHELNVADAPHKNVALATTLEEFRFQIERCGTAIVTEDHVAAHATAGGGAPREQRMITQFTVTAYSPSIAFDGAASAAQLIKAFPPTSGSTESRR